MDQKTDPEKPFKTIEVYDSRTKQLCKVACMSCIRGHRTTSCGIPVCRTKVFWTVKRPGRPSNSCTCRYGATGGCKCVVAKSACPHKAKKGEKRSGECRCDEQGRYCCLLDPEHWKALHALQKPTVDFFPSRELLESKQAASHRMPVPQTPTYPIGSPPSTNSIPSTPIHVMNNGFGNYQPIQSSSLTPRFGMMGVGGPQGSAHPQPPDILAWDGQAPPAPREIILPPMYEPAQSEQSSCCRSSTPRTQSVHSPLESIHHSFAQSNSLQDVSLSQPERSSCCQSSTPGTQSIHSPMESIRNSFSQPNPLQDLPLSQPYNNLHSTTNGTISLPTTMSPPPVYEPPAFDFNRMQEQYYANQFPNAICQNCGLSGCTCRNCPPIFQNPYNTSWAQCCGRKHARDVQPITPAPAKMPRTENYSGEGLRAQASNHASFMPDAYHQSEEVLFGNATGQYGDAFQGMDPRPPDEQQQGFEGFELDHGLLLPDPGQHLDISEFLLSDLDRSDQNGGGIGGGGGVIDDGGGGVVDDGGGGGGCCCRD